MKTEFESIQEVRNDAYPKVSEIRSQQQFKTDHKDPNFDFPLSDLEKEY